MAAVAAGDRLLVRSGEVVPVDGVLEEAAVLDEAARIGRELAAGLLGQQISEPRPQFEERWSASALRFLRSRPE